MQTWDEIQKYLSDLNLNPHKLACGCAVKIDLRRVVYPALHQIKPTLKQWGINLAPREDADISPLYGAPQIKRIHAPFSQFSLDSVSEFKPERAITVTSVYRTRQPEALAQKWLKLYEKFPAKQLQIMIGKGHTIEAYTPEDEFALFDFFLSEKRGQPRGFLIANNDTIQLIDPTIDLGAPQQTAAAINNALNDLFSLGAVQNIQIHPVYAAPNESLRQKILQNLRDHSRRYGFELVEREPVSEKTLLLGATVFAETDRQTPTFYDKIQKGDLILVHRPFGDLAPINLWIEGLVMGDGYLQKLGLQPEEVRCAKDHIVDLLSKPNLEIGRVIYGHSPKLNEAFDPSQHIKATGDLSGPGLDIFQELAENANVDVRLERIPLIYEKLVREASKQFIIPNGTSGTNGALAIVASPKVIQQIELELKKLGHNPQVIGHIERKRSDKGTLTVPAAAKDFISDWSAAFQVAN
ncbi:SelD-related putative sulfur metabolism protein [Candidatus Acetothermia bacterium]|nr:SelD-related putative sulfur metabolism protein [Candidatus Acetothermia bacterium]